VLLVNADIKLGKTNRGIALVIVLWMLVLMTVIAAAISAAQRTEVSLARGQISMAEGRAMAAAGVNYAISQIAAVDSEDAWVADGVSRDWQFKDSDMSISVTEESGRIDINSAQFGLLKGLFAAIGLDVAVQDELAGSIIDWRDSDNLHQQSGAEDADYRAAGIEYGAKDGQFDDVSELRLVKGLSREIFEKIRPAVTVDSRRKSVNRLYASPLVLAAMEGELFDDEGDVAAENTAPTLPTPGNNSPRRGFFGIYRIRCEVPLGDGGHFSVEAVVSADRASNTGFRFNRWNEGV